MPGPIMPAGVRAIMFVDTPRRTTQNVLYYLPDLAPSHQSHIQGIADAIHAWFVAQYVACICSAGRFRGVMAYYSNPGTDIAWEAWSSNGPTVGAYASGSGNVDVMPDEDVAVIRKLTGHAGREDRGRLYVSGMPEAGNINGQLESAYGGVLVALANRVPGDIGVEIPDGDTSTAYNATLHARHWNRKTNVLRPITACIVTSTVMQQRRRRRPLIGLPIAGSFV